MFSLSEKYLYNQRNSEINLVKQYSQTNELSTFDSYIKACHLSILSSNLFNLIHLGPDILN